MSKKFLLLSFLILSVFSCYQLTIQDAYSQWIGKIIKIPVNLSFFVKDSIFSIAITQHPLKLLLYTDSTGCISCKLKLREWQFFNEQLDTLTDKRVTTFIVLASTQKRLKQDLLKVDYHYPISIDYYDSTNILNHFIKDDRFRCFLLDENNKVILIGNPVQNPKIKELYLRTISERLGIDYNPSSSLDSSPEINLGTFSLSESKTAALLVPNNSKSIMQIDSVFTSCECTTASIDKMVVPPSGSANLTVKYTPDGVGEFYREVYVQIKGEDKPLVYKIRGKVE